METLIILLRGVNVGGAGKLPMPDLRKHLTKAGFVGVKTYIQSGNIILSSGEGRTSTLTKVQDIIESSFDFRPAGVVRSIAELESALRQNPFDVEDKRFLHLTFVSPDVTLDCETLQSFCTSAETFALDGQVFYLATPNGYGRSKAAEKLDKALSAEVKTARNLNSCEKILALAKAD